MSAPQYRQIERGAQEEEYVNEAQQGPAGAHSEFRGTFWSALEHNFMDTLRLCMYAAMVLSTHGTLISYIPQLPRIMPVIVMASNIVSRPNQIRKSSHKDRRSHDQNVVAVEYLNIVGMSFLADMVVQIAGPGAGMPCLCMFAVMDLYTSGDNSLKAYLMQWLTDRLDQMRLKILIVFVFAAFVTTIIYSCQVMTIE